MKKPRTLTLTFEDVKELGDLMIFLHECNNALRVCLMDTTKLLFATAKTNKFLAKRAYAIAKKSVALRRIQNLKKKKKKG